MSKTWTFGQLANGIHAGIVVELGALLLDVEVG
jgi:hypothetical protein